MRDTLPPQQRAFTLIEILITISIVATLSLIVSSAYSGYQETAKNARAREQIQALAFLLDAYAFDNDGEYPASLSEVDNGNLRDPWGNPYIYLNLKKTSNSNNSDDTASDSCGDGSMMGMEGGSSMEHGNSSSCNGGGSNTGEARKDGNLVPINTNFDLYSMGKDGKSKPPLRAKDSLDDIIYANDGDYIGLASDY